MEKDGRKGPIPYELIEALESYLDRHPEKKEISVLSSNTNVKMGDLPNEILKGTKVGIDYEKSLYKMAFETFLDDNTKIDNIKTKDKRCDKKEVEFEMDWDKFQKYSNLKECLGYSEWFELKMNNQKQGKYITTRELDSMYGEALSASKKGSEDYDYNLAESLFEEMVNKYECVGCEDEELTGLYKYMLGKIELRYAMNVQNDNDEDILDVIEISVGVDDDQGYIYDFMELHEYMYPGDYSFFDSLNGVMECVFESEGHELTNKNIEFFRGLGVNVTKGIYTECYS